uniref:Uncharacterized protein n=1 Tax=Ixodes ricinus TaxID=34613 RepID=A0A6B0UGQ3_IXORI
MNPLFFSLEDSSVFQRQIHNKGKTVSISNKRSLAFFFKRFCTTVISVPKDGALPFQKILGARHTTCSGWARVGLVLKITVGLRLTFANHSGTRACLGRGLLGWVGP